MNPTIRVTIIGEISEAEQKKIGQDSKPLCEFRVAGCRIRINAWGDLAAKVPAAGGAVIVEGRMNDRSYTAQGEERTTTEITASVIEPLGAAAKPAPDQLDF
jgi:hypothetical protein